jgi:CheY-like chemotaxis protein
MADDLSSSGGAAPPGRGRILLAEDNKINQVVALGILGELGYTVDVAGNGNQALRMGEANEYQAVLIDFEMAELDAYDVTRRWRQRERDKPGEAHTPIIAMAASIMPGDREKSLAAGMDDYMTKPIQRDTVKTSLSRWLGSAIDREQIDELRGLGMPDEPSPLAEIIESFLTQAPAAVNDLAEATQRQDAAALPAYAHSLKGMASAVGANTMTDLCASMAAQARAGDLAGAATTMARLRAEFGRACAELVRIAAEPR